MTIIFPVSTRIISPSPIFQKQIIGGYLNVSNAAAMSILHSQPSLFYLTAVQVDGSKYAAIYSSSLMASLHHELHSLDGQVIFSSSAIGINYNCGQEVFDLHFAQKALVAHDSLAALYHEFHFFVGSKM